MWTLCYSSSGKGSWLAVRRLRKAAEDHGIGRHTEVEVMEMGVKDLRTLSDYLGDSKPFLTGQQPTQLDCAVFGCLAQILWSNGDNPLHRLLDDECANLKNLCHRMKETYWSDWDRYILPPN